VTARAFALTALTVFAVGCAQRLEHPAAPADRVQAEIEGDAPVAFETLVGVYERVLRIGERLRRENTSICGDQLASSMGWTALADRDFGGLEMRKLATQFLRAGKIPVVVALLPEGSAARAGVRVGDHVLSIGGKRVLTAVQVTRAEKSLAASGDSIIIERGGSELELPVTPVSACRDDVQPIDAPDLAASFRGSTIFVTLKLVDLATDDQLAFSIAHAMAQQLLGVDPDGFLFHPQIPEPEATALAVRICERASFSVANAEAILQLEAVEEPWTVITTQNPLANPYWRPKGDTQLGEIPRRIVALRMVRAQSAAAGH
jgi:membrane-associated protease RseP (regulator of RpoE activity)